MISWVSEPVAARRLIILRGNESQNAPVLETLPSEIVLEPRSALQPKPQGAENQLDRVLQERM